MAKKSIPDKICPHCGGMEWDVKTDKRSGRATYYCSQRRKEIDALMRERDKEKVREYKRMWEQNNKEKCNESHRKSYQKHREARLSRRKIYNRLPQSVEKRRERERMSMINLDDNRIKTMLRHQMGVKEIKHKDITPEMVKLKREQLKLYRDVKKEKQNPANS